MRPFSAWVLINSPFGHTASRYVLLNSHSKNPGLSRPAKLCAPSDAGTSSSRILAVTILPKHSHPIKPAPSSVERGSVTHDR
jgi:hypothetical protein